MITNYFINGTILNSDYYQYNFINFDNNFIILNSCAGSGKTRSLILKVKYLIDNNIDPSNIIICAYTKSMANTLKFKMKYHFINYDIFMIGTFHSICYKLLKDDERINDLTYPEEILVYAYENIVNNIINLSNKYLIIDEYQDLTNMQQKIVLHLLEYKKIKGLILIGDIDQTIFSFFQEKIDWNNINIGLKKQNFKSQLEKIGISIEGEENKIEQFNIFRLDINYRSTKDIIDFANCFIENKMISNYTFQKYKPKIYIFDKWIDEINFLCNIIKNYVETNRFNSLGSICIISRYNKTLEYIENRLLEINIGTNYIKSNKVQQYVINLSTIHSAKGLEFDNVYFVNSSYHIDNIEEEKRLLYVCITRAKKQLVISSNSQMNELFNIIPINLYDLNDKRKEKSNIIAYERKYNEWLNITDFIKVLGGEHIIMIKKILSPIMNFKPFIYNKHEKLSKLPNTFNIKNISNTQNIFGLFIDTLINREIQFKLKKDTIVYNEYNKLIISNDYDKLNKQFEQLLKESYLKFSDPNIETNDILYEIFIVSLTNSIFNERLAYQFVYKYIKKEDIIYIKEWLNYIYEYIDTLILNNPIPQKEISNHFLKIIGYSDIIIDNLNLVIDIKTSIYEHPKLEYLMQIILYGLFNDKPINRYQIYNPIYGIIYEWNMKQDETIKNKLIDYIETIIPIIKSKIRYNE